MTKLKLVRVTFSDWTLDNLKDGRIQIDGFVPVRRRKKKPKSKQVRPVFRPIEPDEPDPETEVAYSRNALEPLTLVFKERKVKLTESLYILFRYVYDLYRSEGKNEFEFLEIAEAIKGDDVGMTKDSIENCVKRLRGLLVKLNAPIDVTFKKEVIYIEVKNDLEK